MLSTTAGWNSFSITVHFCWCIVLSTQDHRCSMWQEYLHGSKELFSQSFHFDRDILQLIFGISLGPWSIKSIKLQKQPPRALMYWVTCFVPFESVPYVLKCLHSSHTTPHAQSSSLTWSVPRLNRFILIKVSLNETNIYLTLWPLMLDGILGKING